ncbi:MAG: hypothetical protein ACXWZ4_19315, partial [Gemmatirosa sp.]
VELASERATPAARFVSAAEGRPSGEGRETTRADRRGTARHRAPTPGVRRVAEVRPAPAAAEEPAPTVALVEAPAAAGDDVAPSDVPAVVPAPVDERPVAVGNGEAPATAQGDRDEGDRGRRGRDGGGGWGGVIIRGGSGDIDHCERDMPGRRGRIGGGVVQGAINRRFPGLPTGGWGGPMGGAAGTIIRQVATRPR